MKTIKHIFTAVVGLVLTTTVANAQTNEQALAEIRYDFTHINDLSKPDKPLKEEMVLYIGKQSSVYKSYALAAKKAEMMKQFGQTNSVNMRSISFNAPNLTNTEYYNFSADQKFNQLEKIGLKNVFIPQDYPKINWNITSETMEIGGYTCQKATTDFKGRSYTAWFTTELPFPFGPWKLGGLPGLILQAEDSKQEVVFKYAGFDKLAGDPVLIELPKDATETTQVAFDRAYEAFKKDPMAAVSNSLPPNAISKIVYKDQSGKEISKEEMDAARAAKQPNVGTLNPIELPIK